MKSDGARLPPSPNPSQRPHKERPYQSMDPHLLQRQRQSSRVAGVVRMKNALVLLENGYDELELWVPFYRFLEHGLTAVLVGPKAGETYAGKRGLPARADRAFGEVDLESASVVLIPGGWAPDRIRVHEAAVDLVRRAHDRGCVVAAICHGGSVLVSADVVRGRRVTSTRSIRDDLRAAGATWVDEPVVVDGRLVTSRTPADLPFFLPAILAAAS